MAWISPKGSPADVSHTPRPPLWVFGRDNDYFSLSPKPLNQKKPPSFLPYFYTRDRKKKRERGFAHFRRLKISATTSTHRRRFLHRKTSPHPRWRVHFLGTTYHVSDSPYFFDSSFAYCSSSPSFLISFGEKPYSWGSLENCSIALKK